MESFQGEPTCKLNVNMIERLSSFAPSDITNDKSCFVPITNTMEDINNAQESDSVEEDKGINHKQTWNTSDATTKGHQLRHLL